MIERVGADAVHIEDQAFPKRASYHAGIEHVIAADDMLRKLDVALSARSSDDFLVIARTDSLATHGYDEAIKRAQSYADAGADLVMIFPRNDGEARSAPQDLAGIGLVYVNSLGHTRPAYDVQTLSRWGWKVIYDPSTVVFSAADAIRSGLQRLRNHGSPGSWDSMKATRSYVERVLGLEAAYALERQTVEFADAP
jgi:methylisocitrate lyase